MQEKYRDPNRAASFGGEDALYRAACGKISMKKIREWLAGVSSYTLHRPVAKRFATNRVVVYSIDQQWHADLADMISLRQYNDGYRYILTCVDILSKYAWAVPLKMKRNEDIVKAFEVIFFGTRAQSATNGSG